MRAEPGTRLRDLAAAISDETPVDWQREQGRDPELSSTVGCLQKVEAVATAFRSLAGPGDEAPPSLFSWGSLQVVEKLGEGSFGDVFRAHDPTLDRDVALKLRRPGPSRPEESGRRFVEEARSLARIRHPNVLAVHGADLHDGRVGIWTELIQGQTLADRLAEDGPLGFREAVAIGLDLCRALAAVHAVGLVHGDVKAANVIRERGGRIVLGDFGSAVELGANAATFVSPASSAPELLRGEAPQAASDLYSLGVTLYHLVTDRFPVEASNPGELAGAHERGDHKPLRDHRPDLPSAFIHVVEKALALEPEQRFTSAGAMERALAALSVEAEDQGESAPRPSPRRMPVWAPIVAALVVIAVAGLWIVRVRPQQPSVEHEQAVAGTRLTLSSERAAVVSGAGASAAAAIDVRAQLLRSAVGGSERLDSGAAVRPGDQLFLEIESPNPVHLYVLNEDRAGQLFVLFPIEGLEPGNPLPAGRHRLPGRIDGVPQDWQVTSAGGTETFLAIGSPSRLRDLEREIASHVAASAHPGIGNAETLLLRGVGGLAPAPVAVGGGVLGKLATVLAERRAQGEAIWLAHYELHNPGEL